jgi:hypothetical protein
MVQAEKVAGSLLEEVYFFSNLSNPSGRTITLGSTLPLTEMGTRNPKKKKPAGKVRPARRANNLAGIW